MQTTLNLLDAALEKRKISARELATQLDLSPNALNAARARGHLSPAIAGAIAEQIGADVDHWIVIAALESEKDSSCKQRMLRRYRRVERAMGIEPTS